MLLGIVLAGGLSSRMGSDKALLNWQGEALLSHATRLLYNAGCDQVVINRNHEGYIQDRFVHQGPVAGIHAVLEQTWCDEAVVIPVDMPLLDGISLRELVFTGRALERSCHYQESVLPCYLINPADAVQEANRRLFAGQRSVHGLLQALQACPVTLSNVTPNLFNANTPHEWNSAQQQAEKLE